MTGGGTATTDGLHPLFDDGRDAGVFALRAAGHPVAQIASGFLVTPMTINRSLSKMMDRIGANSSANLIYLGLVAGVDFEPWTLPPKLDRRDQMIVNGIALGMPDSEIARRMVIDEWVVHGRVSALLERADVKSREGLVSPAFERGYFRRGARLAEQPGAKRTVRHDLAPASGGVARVRKRKNSLTGAYIDPAWERSPLPELEAAVFQAQINDGISQPVRFNAGHVSVPIANQMIANMKARNGHDTHYRLERDGLHKEWLVPPQPDRRDVHGCVGAARLLSHLANASDAETFRFLTGTTESDARTAAAEVAAYLGLAYSHPEHVIGGLFAIGELGHALREEVALGEYIEL